MSKANYCPGCNGSTDDENLTFKREQIVSGGYITNVQKGYCDCGCLVARYERNGGPAAIPQ